MRRLCTGVLVAAAALAVTVTTGGSAYAGGSAQVVTPAPVTAPDSVTMQDDTGMGMCRSHRAHLNDSVPSTGM